MLQRKYMKIDKTMVCMDSVSKFSIYFPLSLDSEMECIIEKGKNVSPENRDSIREISSLFINISDKEEYKMHCNNFAKKADYHKKSTAVYSKATDAINELYHNPETLGGKEKSKEVVNDLVQTILDDEFTIRSLMAIATHDYYTHTHSLNVSVYALSLGSFLKLNEVELSELGEAALLHDLGKSKVAVEIINKNGKLTDEEFTKMKKHPELGFHLAVSMGIKNKNTLHGIRHHHEKMDGSGYPSGLKGDSIPLTARIVGLCDIFDALTSKRSYKEAMTTFDALKLIKTNMNNHVDLKLLNVMIKMFQ